MFIYLNEPYFLIKALITFLVSFIALNTTTFFTISSSSLSVREGNNKCFSFLVILLYLSLNILAWKLP